MIKLGSFEIELDALIVLFLIIVFSLLIIGGLIIPGIYGYRCGCC